MYRAIRRPDGAIQRTIDGIVVAGADYRVDRATVASLFNDLGGEFPKGICTDARDGEFVPDTYYVQYNGQIAEGYDGCTRPAGYAKTLEEAKRIVAEIFALQL